VKKNLLVDHPNLTSTLIAHLMYSEIVQNKDMEAKYIQIAVKTRYKYNIPYRKAWRAKQWAIEKRFGTFIDSYGNVVCLLHTLKERNPGTYVDIPCWMNSHVIRCYIEYSSLWLYASKLSYTVVPYCVWMAHFSPFSTRDISSPLLVWFQQEDRPTCYGICGA
jgi:hypothetical protein